MIAQRDALEFDGTPPGGPNPQANEMLPEEISGAGTQVDGGCVSAISLVAVQTPRETNGACGLDAPGGEALPGGMVAGEIPEQQQEEVTAGRAHETPPGNASPSDVVSQSCAAVFARRRKLWEDWTKLEAKGLTLREGAHELGTSRMNLWRLMQAVKAGGEAAMQGQYYRSGRKPKYQISQGEIACVREIYARLDESEARGRGLGSSKITAFRLAAKSDDPRISENFRTIVLKRKRKGLPPSFESLLDTPASVLDYSRDKRSTTANYVTTPRGRTWVTKDGRELPLRAGTIMEADDGTFNCYAWIPWPHGGDKCSDKFGVKLGRWQLLAAVDARWEFCCAFDVVARNLSSYRGEDSGALLGRTMAEVCVPEIWRLERGSWESDFVRSALDLCQVPVVNAWHSKQKNAVERFFDRFWTPASLIPGHVGRDRGRYKQVSDLAMACQDGRRDPRQHFLPLAGDSSAMLPRVIKAVQFVNSEPVESKSWGSWIPQERFEAQIQEDNRTRLDPSLRIFFSREQKEWTVRGCVVGGNVDSPLIRFPIYFQCPELWEFEGCKVRCYFDPYAETVLGTLVLQDEWRSLKPGHVIAREVPALDLPPQVVLAADGWAEREFREKSLQVRKAIAKAVRTESWNWLGKTSSEARDGMGNVSRRESGAVQPLRSPAAVHPTERIETPVLQAPARGAVDLPWSLRKLMAEEEK